MTLKVSLFQFFIGQNGKVAPRKLRGYLGGAFSEHEVLHNHSDGGFHYRYPLVQYKILDGLPTIVTTGEGSDVIYSFFPKLNEVNIDGDILPVFERRFREYRLEYGDTEDRFRYEFLTPWFPLNQDNYDDYEALETFEAKEEELERILTGNILSQAKGLDYWIDNRLKVELDFYSLKRPVYHKGVKFHGFKGSFTVNFNLPDYLGLGKSVSHGFGTVKRIIK
jgi:hypothetical protein